MNSTDNFKTLTDREKPSPGTPSRREIWKVFDRIAHRYDLLNRLLSFRQDVRWRTKIAEYLPDYSGQVVLDLATGTADVLLSLFAHSARIQKGIGIDMAREMLHYGRLKIEQNSKREEIHLLPGDAMHLPFTANRFDAVTIAFGIRNVSDVTAGLREMYRVLKPGGRVLILEFSLPRNPVIRHGYLLYFRHVLPVIGGWISGDSAAYHYLNQTVESFPYGAQFCGLMQAAGFSRVRELPLTLGIAALYIGNK